MSSRSRHMVRNGKTYKWRKKGAFIIRKKKLKAEKLARRRNRAS